MHNQCRSHSILSGLPHHKNNGEIDVRGINNCLFKFRHWNPHRISPARNRAYAHIKNHLNDLGFRDHDSLRVFLNHNHRVWNGTLLRILRDVQNAKQVRYTK